MMLYREELNADGVFAVGAAFEWPPERGGIKNGEGYDEDEKEARETFQGDLTAGAVEPIEPVHSCGDGEECEYRGCESFWPRQVLPDWRKRDGCPCDVDLESPA